MASIFISKVKCLHVSLFILVTISASNLHAVKCVELDVGGDHGWATPSSKNQQFYNDWASKNRFQINDTLRFAYKKDSVMEVTEEEYEKCESSHPMFFSNDGDTVFALDRDGLFYFISGVSGHCGKGLKMIVKVLEPESPRFAAADTSHHKSAADVAAFPMALLPFVPPFVGFIFM